MDQSTRWILTRPGSARRAELERLVRDVYAAAYGARIEDAPPWLAGVADVSRNLVGAIGARPAQSEPLFLERYLDEPVERLASAALARTVPRTSIAEVGSLASTWAGAGGVLMSSLAAYLDGAGFDVVVFTATRTLRNRIRRWEAPAHDLGPARVERAGPDAERWGSYYATDPRVLAVELRALRAALARDVRLADVWRTVWDEAWHDGARNRRMERAS